MGRIPWPYFPVSASWAILFGFRNCYKTLDGVTQSLPGPFQSGAVCVASERENLLPHNLPVGLKLEACFEMGLWFSW